jgi:vacuolar-type H+-ATPase subunit C/Vma6
MIGRLLTYPYGNARSRALATRLFRPEELAEMAAAGSRKAAIALLDRRLPGNEPFATEQRLQLDFLHFARLILRTLPEPAAELLRTYLRRNWVENLQSLCRIVLGAPPPAIFPQPLPVLDSPPLPEPGEIANLRDLAARLPAGPYRELLYANPPSPGKDHPGRLENGLIRTYWQMVASAIERLPAFDRAAAGEILGLRAAIDALRILQRGRDADLDTERILGAWPAPARLLDPERLRRALRSADPGDALRNLLRRAVPGEEPGEDLEMALRRRLYRELRRQLVSAPFDISIPLATLLLKELEVMDLQGILGGLRYGLPPDGIKPFLSSLKG